MIEMQLPDWLISESAPAPVPADAYMGDGKPVCIYALIDPRNDVFARSRAAALGQARPA